MAAGLVAQVSGAVPSTALELLTNATGVTQGIVILLAALSLLSWAIILAKGREFRAVADVGRAFRHEFEQATGVDEMAAFARRGASTPFSRVLDRAMLFLTETRPAISATADRTARLSASQVEALRLVLDSETSAERDRLGRFIPWLATIGSASPLIGLLGTVLGIIESFIGIATSGAGNIGAVAPGVATALVATAAALIVAIPAVFGYNLFANRLNRIDSELEGFGSELIALMVQEGRI